MKILIVEDDRDLCDTLYETLLSRSLDVYHSYNGDEALELLYEHSYEMLILDINLPGKNGFEILQEAKKHYPHIAALFMTALDTPDHIEKSFGSGGDDYIRKPFTIQELLFRIDAISKRLYRLDSLVIPITPTITYNLTQEELTIGNKKVFLKPKLQKLLHILATHKESIVSREMIESQLWESEDLPDSAILRIYIKELRSFLGEQSITNVRGVGYKLETI